MNDYTLLNEQTVNVSTRRLRVPKTVKQALRACPVFVHAPHIPRIWSQPSKRCRKSVRVPVVAAVAEWAWISHLIFDRTCRYPEPAKYAAAGRSRKKGKNVQVESGKFFSKSHSGLDICRDILYYNIGYWQIKMNNMISMGIIKTKTINK